jgi:hypothetical protein
MIMETEYLWLRKRSVAGNGSNAHMLVAQKGKISKGAPDDDGTG